MEQQAKEIAELLKVMANQHRLMILCYLIERPMNVSEIHEKIPAISQSALSQNLAMLKAHGIVDSNKYGLQNVYHIKDDRIKKIIQALRETYCNSN
ncbi:ArsR/SmtB family transcription factor [Acetivibrio straminisolvens]|jgi:DNA-binding HxlR family transcriptional regulator|uniref:Transcriptional regulator n=1 Tax=Acetivibrio straminisolvens JCM 21531 TaxID=1294263 RepID=W4V441_9FIRM|nr:metalloregulator ArsR/SmtB family transcription factor [Acetivibrio straminisolvens]GAE87941.1 transcriptional regulator [Acetivibrio straminisolvens JCM 21531]